MSTYRIAIVGSKESVAGFALLGVDVVAVEDGQPVNQELLRLKREMRIENGKERNVYGIVFVAENLLQTLAPDDARRLARGALPAIIPLPSHHGASGYGLQRLTAIVERAVGSNILA